MKIPIVRECFANAEPSHYRERNMVYNPSLACITAVVCGPRRLDFMLSRFN